MFAISPFHNPEGLLGDCWLVREPESWDLGVWLIKGGKDPFGWVPTCSVPASGLLLASITVDGFRRIPLYGIFSSWVARFTLGILVFG